MDVRAHIAMVFHLDKCIGCHTCSVACKNVWTDRPGAEYMWWNNVETKPGTGFPTLWEDQKTYRGGWEVTGTNGDRTLRLKCQGKISALLKLFYNPNQPGLEEYYEPWTYAYDDLFDAPEGDDQPTARPVSLLTGAYVDIKAGPNWDDDLSGSPIYAENDPNLAALSPREREQLFEVERLSMMYLPRICNHCANPACVAACPSGAIYKRGEDGIVLINQEKCRGWRACVSACPYKKIFYNWKTGKSEKCILCYPRLETGQPPACFQACVGRIRYMGVLLYDAGQVPGAMSVPDRALVESQRRTFLDPEDERVREAALANGLSEELLEAARRSPVYKFVAEWKLALPLHVEYRTMPMLFYVPPLSPVMGAVTGAYGNVGDDLFAGLADARIPVRYLASLFSAGNVEIVEGVLRKLLAVRYFKRAQDLADVDADTVRRMLRDADLTADEAEAIYALTTLATFEQRFVLPPTQREEALEGLGLGTPEMCKGEAGFGLVQIVRRGA